MRIRHVKTQQEAEQLTDEFITQNYKIQTQGTQSIKVKKTEYGSLMAHIFIAILTAWWTLFLGNIIYAIYKYMSGEEVLIKIDTNE